MYCISPLYYIKPQTWHDILWSVSKEEVHSTQKLPHMTVQLTCHNLYHIKDQEGIHSCERRKKTECRNKDFMWERIRNKIMQSAIVYKHSLYVWTIRALCVLLMGYSSIITYFICSQHMHAKINVWHLPCKCIWCHLYNTICTLSIVCCFLNNKNTTPDVKVIQ